MDNEYLKKTNQDFMSDFMINLNKQLIEGSLFLKLIPETILDAQDKLSNLDITKNSTIDFLKSLSVPEKPVEKLPNVYEFEGSECDEIPKEIIINLNIDTIIKRDPKTGSILTCKRVPGSFANRAYVCPMTFCVKTGITVEFEVTHEYKGNVMNSTIIFPINV